MGQLGVGDLAPDFEASGTGEGSYRLSSNKGRPVVLVFYPGDGTAVCTKQLRSYSSDLGAFGDVDAVLLGISPQDVASHERFATKEGLKMPLLHDADKKIAEAYGVLGPLGFYRRSVFVVDGAGRITYAKRGLLGLNYVKMDEIAEAVRANP